MTPVRSSGIESSTELAEAIRSEPFEPIPALREMGDHRAYRAFGAKNTM